MIRRFFKSSPALCAVTIMFVTLLPVMIMRDASPSNELRYLSIADEAISEGHVFAFTNQGEDYADKPPFYFWLLMLSKLLFGEHQMFVLSLLSFVPASVIILVMDRWLVSATRHSGPALSPLQRFAAALMLGTSALFTGMSVFLRMDMLMCMFITLALYSFYKMYSGIGNFRTESILFPLYTFLALFTKGPVGLIVPLLCAAVFLLVNGRIKEAGRYLGWKTWGILVLLSGLWLLGVYLEAGTSYLNNLLFHQTVDRAVDAFHHKEPFWYYMVVFWYIFAPYSLLYASSCVGMFRDRGSVSQSLFAVVFFTTLLVLSCFSSKLAIYLAPVYPFLMGIFVLHIRNHGWNTWYSVMLAIPLSILILAGVVLVLLPFLRTAIPLLSVLEKYSFAGSFFIPLAGLVLAVVSAMALSFLFGKRKSWEKAVASTGLAILLTCFSVAPVLPQLNDYIGYANLCKAAKSVKEASSASGYVTLMVHRPENMDVYLGEDVISFGKRPFEFADSDISNVVLIVKTSAVSEYSVLEERLKDAECAARVGEYSVYVVS